MCRLLSRGSASPRACGRQRGALFCSHAHFHTLSLPKTLCGDFCATVSCSLPGCRHSSSCKSSFNKAADAAVKAQQSILHVGREEGLMKGSGSGSRSVAVAKGTAEGGQVSLVCFLCGSVACATSSKVPSLGMNIFPVKHFESRKPGFQVQLSRFVGHRSSLARSAEGERERETHCNPQCNRLLATGPH